MAISVGNHSVAQRSAQSATQTPAQPIKSKSPSQPQPSKGDVSKTDLAPGLKQAAQLAAGAATAAAGQGAAQAATKAVGAFVNTKA